MKRKSEGELAKDGWTSFDSVKGVTHHLGEGTWIMTTFLPQKLHPSKDDLAKLWALRPDELGEIMMMGNRQVTPRYFQSYGRSYTFSGKEHMSIPIPPILQTYLNFANQVCETMLKRDYGGRQFNMAFVNWYMDGNQYIGYHPDKEAELYKNERGETLVFSISFGAERRFLLKSMSTKKVKEFKLGDCSCLLMAGQCQKKFKHSVPKELGVKGKRVNLTFRIFKPVSK